MEHKRKRGRPRKDSQVWYHPDSDEAKKQGEEMYNEIMGETKYTKFKSNEERKAYTGRIAKEYLDAHPEEVIKLRDEGLVQEMVDFAAKQTGQSPLAVTEAPTEEEVYLAKREAEGRPLIEHEEAGAFPTKEQIELMKEESKELDNHFNRMSDEAQARLVEAIQTVNNALHNHPHARAHKRPAGSDWDIDNKAYEESKARIKIAIQNEKDIQKEIKGGATTYPLKNFDYTSTIDQAKEGWTEERRDKFIKAWNESWHPQYVAGHDPIDGNNEVNIAKVHRNGRVEYLNKKGEIVEPEEEHEELYHTSLMEANSRAALIMMLVVFLVILAYLIWM